MRTHGGFLHATNRLLLTILAASVGVTVASHSAVAAPCASTNVRWASSSNTLYVTGAGVSCTLSEIDTLLPKAPLEQVGPATWLISTNIVLQEGATLELKGTAVGGDANEVRLKSDSKGIVWLRADWGSIMIDSTKVTSWDASKNGPDTDYSSTNKRAFIHVRSSLGPDGTTARESRMNITKSDIGYLGYDGAEAYGLAWKVSGSGAGLYDKVNVLGDVVDSHIHHNYFGAYTFGAYGMNWRNNEMDHNAQYGLDPHDDSDNLIIEDNNFHDNGNHGLICSQRCDHLTIRHNTSSGNVGNGIMLHRLVTASLVEDNTVTNNGDAGIAIFDSSFNTIRHNTITNNQKGIRLSVAAADNTIADNTISNSVLYGLYFYKGTDAPTSGDGWVRHNTFTNNDITGSGTYGIKMKEGDANIFTNNRFISNGQSLFIESSTNNRFESNTISKNKAVGLSLSKATGHKILNNTIENNGPIGIQLASSSNTATITGNTIRNHTKYGISLGGSKNSTVKDNTFVNNKQNIGS